jgi:hypothetical protein
MRSDNNIQRFLASQMIETKKLYIIVVTEKTGKTLMINKENARDY